VHHIAIAVEKRPSDFVAVGATANVNDIALVGR
jgi:hypothetical protein